MKNLKFVFLLLLFSCISLQTSNMSQNTEKAYFAGGCFWCMEPPFEALDGVLEAPQDIWVEKLKIQLMNR